MIWWWPASPLSRRQYPADADLFQGQTRVTPEINALTALIMVLVMAIVTIAGILLHRQQKQQQRA